MLYTIWIFILTAGIDKIILAVILMSSGIIFDIKRYAINDGPGIRTAVFFKGCPLECWWCHNPEGQASQPQLMFRQNRCKLSAACVDACPQGAIHWMNGPVTDWEKCDNCGECAEVCYAGAREIIGREMSASQLMLEIERDIPFYDQSGGGVTFTGGEPMAQFEFLEEVLRLCKAKQIHTALDTSGYTSWEKLESILPKVDLFLYDIKIMDNSQHLQYTSVSNKLILNNLTRLSEAGAHILIRLPIIPAINDDPGNLEAAASFLQKLPCLDGVELMPYHNIGMAKFQALGMVYKLDQAQSPTSEQIRIIENKFRSYQLPVISHQGRAV
jgi:pyruvate formate lyase activating enzyme